MPPREGDGPFLRAIEADFDADLPRLVYADWLEERGTTDDGVRARFIRWQCDAANSELALQLFPEFGPGVYPRMRGNLPREPLVRGFPQPQRWPANLFVKHVAEFRVATPLPPTLRLVGGDAGIEAALAVPDLEAVRSLTLGDITPRAAALFAACPHLAGLTHFGWAGRIHGAAPAGVLAESANFRRLTGLYLHYANELTRDQLAEFLRAPADLRELSFTRQHHHFYDRLGIPDEWFGALAAPLPELRSLTLDMCLNDPASAFDRATGLAGLEELRVRNMQFGDAEVARLLRAPHLQSVRRLEVSHYDGKNWPPTWRLTDAGARLILADPRPWEAVDLAGSAVSAGVLAEVAARCGAGRRMPPPPGGSPMAELTLESLARRVEELERAAAARAGVLPPARDWRSVCGISEETEFSRLLLAEMAAIREGGR